MATLIDTSLWIDLTRAKSPTKAKKYAASYILDPLAHLAEPVAFELLRHATPAEVRQLNQLFGTLPMLTTPTSLWADAGNLGQACRRKGISVGALDLLIAAIALFHSAEVVTFDDDYPKIATVASLQVKLLQRP